MSNGDDEERGPLDDFGDSGELFPEYEQGVIYEREDYKDLGMQEWQRHKEGDEQGVGWDVKVGPFSDEEDAKDYWKSEMKKHPSAYAQGREAASWGIARLVTDDYGNILIQAKIVIVSGHGPCPEKKRRIRIRRGRR